MSSKSAKTSPIVWVTEYSAKAVAVFGNIEPYKATFEERKGLFNPSLQSEDGRAPGYIFPKTRRAEAEKIVQEINAGAIKPGDKSDSFRSTVATASSASAPSNVPQGIYVERKAFLALVSRMDQVEQELALLKKTLKLPSATPADVGSSVAAKSRIVFSIGSEGAEAEDDFSPDADEDDVENPDTPARLMRRKK